MIEPPGPHEDDRIPRGPARPQDPGRAGPRFAREVEYHARAFLFGRYDMRGGATLILATHTATALRRYEQVMNLGPEQDAGYDDLLAGGRVRLVVCDLPLPPAAGELLAGYGGIGPGRLLARVDSRVIPPGATAGSGPWAETDLAVLWVEPAGDFGAGDDLRGAPEILDGVATGPRSEYRLRAWECGGDAWGLYFEPVPGP